MKPVGQLKILNQQPYILLSHEDLCAIEHIVDIAPKEAQWFHRVEQMETDDGQHVYRLYDMYIPEQWCSGAEVSSDPEMFIKMYKELVEKHGQDKTNEILSSMDAWCHSHHNMGVNPSGQDIKQFKEQCERAEADGKQSPQIMMIFNKKNQYYCRIWDPLNKLMFENVEIVVGNYDFSWIDSEAKEKFKTKKAKTVTKGRSAGPGAHEWHTAWHTHNSPYLDINDLEFDMDSPSGEAKKKSKEHGKKGKKSSKRMRLR